MYSTLTKDELTEWRRTTEKITLEEFAKRLGKSLETKKETNDLHDLFLKRKGEPEEIKGVIKPVKEPKPDFEIKITFNKELNEREEVVFNYFCRNRKQKVTVKDLARVLNLPNDYVYKYIKNLRSKLANNVLVNADKGGYILNV